jgi:hypothetical protein
MRFRTTAHAAMDISIDISGGTGRYVGQVRFSAEPFVSDRRTTRQCAGLSGVFSDIASAQNGYPNGPLDLAGWQKLMGSARDKLAAVDGSGAVGTQLAALTDWYGRSNPAPAQGTSADANQAYEIVHNLCLDNGTPIAILSQYGG